MNGAFPHTPMRSVANPAATQVTVTRAPLAIPVVIGRGGPNLIKGMVYGRDILDSLKLPYRMFGYDTSMILTLEYAKKIDEWWGREGRRRYLETTKP